MTSIISFTILLSQFSNFTYRDLVEYDLEWMHDLGLAFVIIGPIIITGAFILLIAATVSCGGNNQVEPVVCT